MIQFGDGILFPGLANTINSRKIQINTSSGGIAPYDYPNDFGVATFGYEISHLMQRPRRNRYSIQAEMYAQFVGGQIYLDLGNPDFTFMDSFSIELLTGSTNPTSTYPYNPFTEEGLKAAQKHLSSAQGGFVYKLLPVKSKTLTQDWLNHLSVSWYKTETWYIDYQLNSRPR